MQNCRLPTDVSLEGDVSREDSIVTVALQPFYSFLEDCNLQLTASHSDEVVDMFVEMGADSVEDLDFVNERDLAGILPLIKCRKLMFFINKMKSQRNVISADPIVNSADSIVTSRSSVASGDESSNVHDKSSNIPSIPCQRFSKGIRQRLENCNCNYIVIVITFYSPSCLGQETAKGPFGLRVKLSPAHLSTTHSGGFKLSL